jgi:branched-chain amino acid aminotransferase
VPTLIRIDGETFTRREDAKVSVFDHGFLYGDSVYEVFRTYGGHPFEVGPHLARLAGSARGIALELPWSAAELAGEVERLVRDAACPGETYIRLIVTRGVGEIDLNPAACARPSLILIAKDLPPPAPDLYERGISLAIVTRVRNEPGTVDPAIKTGNYLNSVLAHHEAKRRGASEAVMLNARGDVTECPTSNIFLVRDGILRTPSLESGILSGITRSDVLRLARENRIPVRDETVPAKALRDADEVFITSTTRGIMPVATLDNAPLRRSAPGEVTRRLMDLFRAEVDAFVAAERARRATS